MHNQLTGIIQKRNSQDSTQFVRIKFLFSQDADNADHSFLDLQYITPMIINYIFSAVYCTVSISERKSLITAI